MRTLPLSLLVPAALLPLVAPHALEAVAQSPVGAGSSSGAANLATDAKLTAVKAESAALKQTVTELKTELKNVTDCAAQGKLWNGSVCVATQGDNGDDGNKGDDGKIAIPSCKSSERLTAKDGSLMCEAEKCIMKYGVGKAKNNTFIHHEFSSPFTEAPVGILASPIGTSTAPITTTNYTANGFDAYGQSYPNLYPFVYVALSKGCFE